MSWEYIAKNGVYYALCAVFGMDPESEEALARFVPAYEYTVTTPQADRNANVCYYALRERQSTNLDYTEVTYARKKDEGANARVGKNIPFTAELTFYGPQAYQDAELFWSVFQIDLDNTSARSKLRRLKIVPDGRPSRPLNNREVEGTFIRLRSDVELDLVLFDVSEIGYGTVDYPPEFVGFEEAEKPDPENPEDPDDPRRWNQWGIFYQL